MQNYRNLTIWSAGTDLVKTCYELTRKFPKSEEYVLTSQIRRASVSIPANIAEGTSRRSEKDFFRFLEIALGSAFELETLLQLSCDLNYISEQDFQLILEKLQEERKMLYYFMQKLKT